AGYQIDQLKMAVMPPEGDISGSYILMSHIFYVEENPFGKPRGIIRIFLGICENPRYKTLVFQHVRPPLKTCVPAAADGQGMLAAGTVSGPILQGSAAVFFSESRDVGGGIRKSHVSGYFVNRRNCSRKQLPGGMQPGKKNVLIGSVSGFLFKQAAESGNA